MKNEELIKMAKEAYKNSYSPYSGFKVGAAIMTEDNEIFTGCNIENLSYGATVCAERVAIFKAVSQGKRKIKKLAVVSEPGKITYPCGMCLQVMGEFMDKDGIIILENGNEIIEYQLKELMPYGFDLNK